MSHSRASYLLTDLALLFAATMWGLFWYPLRLFEANGMPAIWVTLVAFSCALLTGVVYTWKKWPEYRRYPLTLLLIGLSAGWCNAAFLVALVEGNAIRVILLFYLSPVWTVILGHYILKEKLSLQAFLIFALAFIGAMIMLWDPEVGFPWPQNQADWLALSSGFAFALSNVLIRALQDISIAVKTTASWLGCVAIAGVWILLADTGLAGIPEAAWYYSMLLGFCGIVFMTLSVQYGVTHMPVYRSAIILLFEIPVTAISVYWLAGETMNTLEWTGGVIVAISSLLIARVGKQT
jgi:drug/metabolite transporter (DMT)-like permease